jgi:hypothetical protein
VGSTSLSSLFSQVEYVTFDLPGYSGLEHFHFSLSFLEYLFVNCTSSFSSTIPACHQRFVLILLNYCLMLAVYAHVSTPTCLFSPSFNSHSLFESNAAIYMYMYMYVYKIHTSKASILHFRFPLTVSITIQLTFRSQMHMHSYIQTNIAA